MEYDEMIYRFSSSFLLLVGQIDTELQSICAMKSIDACFYERLWLYFESSWKFRVSANTTEREQPSTYSNTIQIKTSFSLGLKFEGQKRDDWTSLKAHDKNVVRYLFHKYHVLGDNEWYFSNKCLTLSTQELLCS